MSSHGPQAEANSSRSGIGMNSSTRDRIARLALERKRSMQTKAERKSAVFASMDQVEDEDFVPSPIGRRQSEPTRSPRRMKSKSAMAKINHCESEREDTERSQDQEDGALGLMLEKTKPTKRRGARSVASSPAGTSSGGSHRRRSKSPHTRKVRHQSSGTIKRSVASPGPMKRRSASPGPMKDTRSRTPSSPRKDRPPKSPERRMGTVKIPSKSSGATNDGNGGLGLFLEASTTKSRSRRNGGSVASAPVATNKDGSNRKPRRASRAPTSKRSRSTDGDAALVDDPPEESPRRRTMSVDNYNGEHGKQDHNNGADAPESPKNFSQRLSRRFRSFTNRLGGSSRKIVGYERTDSGSDRDDRIPPREQKPPSRRARPSARTNGQTKRSNSAGPLSNNRAKTINRRAALVKSKQKNDGSDDEEEEHPDRGAPVRAQSMMLHREATRRGKSNSLMDLQQYSEDEIHSTSYFASNHVLVNRERMKRGLRPLTRNVAMDELARNTAQKMADSEGKSTMPATYVGNVLRGESIRAIHRAVMQNKEGRERGHLLSPYFQDFGVGTAKGKDGMLYICQLFSERIELTITDTT